MNFKRYLLENFENSRHKLTYQKLLAALDTAHVSKGDASYEFSLGSVVKDSSLNGLHVKIEQGTELFVKLGKHKDGRYVIVISVDTLPERLEIDSMFSTNRSLMNKFVTCVADYYNNFRTPSETEPNKQERAQALMDGKNVEQSYDKLIDAIDSKLAEYSAALDDLETTSKQTVNMMTKASAEQAKQKLRNDYFGQNEAEFIKKIKKMDEAEFMQHLDKEMQKKLQKRLENYYDQKL